MSYTIIQDPQQAKRDLENVVNRVVRHCRIGKVTRKPQRPSDLPHVPFSPKVTWPPPLPPYKWWDDPFAPTWSRPGTGYVNPNTVWIS